MRILHYHFSPGNLCFDLHLEAKYDTDIFHLVVIQFIYIRDHPDCICSALCLRFLHIDAVFLLDKI